VINIRDWPRRDLTKTRDKHATFLRDFKTGNFICPGCDKRFSREAMERHHVVARCEGGLTEPHNVIGLCGKCHAMIDHDRRIRMKVNYYMMCLYGLRFAMRHPTAREPVRNLVRAVGRHEADRQIKTTGEWVTGLSWDVEDWEEDCDGE